MRSRQIVFFATRSDLLPGVTRIEHDLEVKYVRSDGSRTRPDFECLDTLREWELLGSNTTGNHHDGFTFLLLPRKTREMIERVPQKGGGVRYLLNQRKNPDTVSFRPGGIYRDQKALVSGHIGTASESATSIALYKELIRRLFVGFTRVEGYRVGPEATQLMNAGYRMITIGINSPVSADLKPLR